MVRKGLYQEVINLSLSIINFILQFYNLLHESISPVNTFTKSISSNKTLACRFFTYRAPFFIQHIIVYRLFYRFEPQMETKSISCSCCNTFRTIKEYDVNRRSGDENHFIKDYDDIMTGPAVKIPSYYILIINRWYRDKDL